MKLTAFILLIACLHVSAEGITQVTFSGKDVPLEKVFEAIKKQTGYSFLYKSDLIKKARPVTIDVKNEPVEKVLSECLKGQPFEFNIENRTIFILPKKNEVSSEPTPNSQTINIKQIDVTGRVINEKGEPVGGVSVTIKGTNAITTTNSNGEFSLKSVDADAVLVFTHVSMETFELRVSGKTDLTINLKTKVSALGDVTVTINTGYEKIPKERATGSYAQLDSQNFHRRIGMNIIDRLDGTVPGLLFNKKGSAAEFPIQIRGISTLGIENTSSDPLIVVDNFPMPPAFDINNINPNDVENITVLKDAAAASIWGSRAGNGVIVITTKKGKYNQRFRLDVSSNITIEEKPNLNYYERISTSDFIDIEKFLFDNAFYDGDLSNTFTYPVVSPVVEILESKRSGLITDAEATNQINALRQYDYRKELNKYVYREAVRQQHYIGFSGGNNALAYQFSFGYNRGLNNIQGSKADDRFTINTNTNFRPIKNLEFQAGIELALARNKSYNFEIPSTLFPYSRLKDDNGNSLAIPNFYRMGYADTAGAGQLLDWLYRPIDEIKYADRNTTSNFARLYFGVNYQFANWLSASVNYQYQYSNAHFSDYKSLQTWYTRNQINRFTDFNQSDPNFIYAIPKGGILDLTDGEIKNYNLRGSLNFDKNFGNLHQVIGFVSGEISDSKGGFTSSKRFYGYNKETGSFQNNIDYLNPHPRIYGAYPGEVAFIPNNDGFTDVTINRFVSVLANASYVYNKRYTLYASARKDGANVFGVNTNNKWKPLWSVGTGWEISKESFYRLSWMPLLKLRASYGYTGNSNNGLSGKFIITHLTYPDEITNLPVSLPGLAPNPDLRWEEVRITNIGLDFNLFQNRLAGTFELFRKNSRDVIANAPMPPSSGVSTFTLNFATLKTNGYEITLNSKNTKGSIEWTSNFGWSRAKTVVSHLYTSLGSKVGDFSGYNINAVPGMVVYGIASYRWAGLDPNTGDPQGYYNGQVSKDYDAILNDSLKNQVFHGSALPLSSAYLRNNISWKAFTLSFNITGRFNYYFREPALTLDYSATMTGTSYNVDYYQRWQKPGDEKFTNVPSAPYPSINQRSLFYQYAELHVKRADNIRWQDASLSWQMTLKDTKLFQSMRVFVYVNNLNVILWRTADSRYDPDFSGGSGNTIAGPVPKTWTGGVTINF